MRLLLAALGLAMVAGLSAGASSAAHAEGRLFFVDPDTVSSGQTTVGYGRGFCSSSSCSSVTITLDQRVAASSVSVKPDGTFAASIVVTESTGTYRVEATQTGADGSVTKEVAGLAVAATDYSSDAPQAPNPATTAASPATTAAPPATTAAPPATTSEPKALGASRATAGPTMSLSSPVDGGRDLKSEAAGRSRPRGAHESGLPFGTIAVIVLGLAALGVVAWRVRKQFASSPDSL